MPKFSSVLQYFLISCYVLALSEALIFCEWIAESETSGLEQVDSQA